MSSSSYSLSVYHWLLVWHQLDIAEVQGFLTYLWKYIFWDILRKAPVVQPVNKRSALKCPKKILIPIILVNIDITIIQTIIFWSLKT